MGDETQRSELEHGNDDPLHSTRKPSTAESVEEEAADVAQMPTVDEIRRRDARREQ